MPKSFESARRRLLQGVAAAAATPRALAQPGKAVRRVGVVFSTDPQTSRPYLDALAKGLDEHGYRRERDYVFEVRHAEGRPESYPALVRELLDARAEVIVVGGNSSVLAAKAATNTVPIVMAGALAPDTTGLLTSLARPGGNVTGVANLTGSLLAKRLQLLHELLPGAAHVAYLTNPAVPGWDRTVKVVEEAGATMALRITTVETSTADEIDRALAALAHGRPMRCWWATPCCSGCTGGASSTSARGIACRRAMPISRQSARAGS
jgi:putative ABC transport system substrate-binding protein